MEDSKGNREADSKPPGASTEKALLEDSADGNAATEEQEAQQEEPALAASSNPKFIVDALDQQVVAELLNMGFTAVSSEKAVHFTNNSGLDAAVGWLAEHEDDEDLQVPLSEAAEESGSAKPKYTKEEAMAKARELQNRIRDERIQKEKKESIEREKRRIESVKQAQGQQRKLEEEERKRHVRNLQKDKQDHQQERERQRLLLKQEWEERFGVPYVDPSAPSTKQTLEEEQASVSKKSIKDQVIHWCSRLKQTYKDTDKEGLVKCLSTIKAYATNMLNNPTELKYRKIRKENAAFQTRVHPYEGAAQLLQAMGFSDEGDHYAVSGTPDGFILGQTVKFVDVILQQLSS